MGVEDGEAAAVETAEANGSCAQQLMEDSPAALLREDETKVGIRSAYSAATVAAISSLASGESPLFFDTENYLNAEKDENESLTFPKKQKHREITLEDRASAMISVYKDYLDEVKDDDDNELDQNENIVNGLEMTPGEKNGLDVIPSLHSVKNRVLNVHERRKEDHKVAILDKFCKDVEEGHTAVYGGGKTCYTDADNYDNDEGGSTQGSYSKSKKKKTLMTHPTAASTTAAFRLRAEVALKAAATKTKSVAKNAAVAVKTKYKDKTTNSSKLMQKIGLGMENDYDFADYDNDYHGDKGIGELHFLTSQNTSSRQLENGNGIYGMHMLQREDEIKSLKRKGRFINDEEMESMEQFNEICDELGVTPESHSNLHYFYQQNRSRYKYPVFRSKKCKRAMLYGAICLGFCVLVVSLMSALTHGFEDIKRNKPLPDWQEDEDWRSKQKEAWEKEHGIISQPQNSSPETADDAMAAADQLQELFYKVSSAYRPIWYDRTTGWSGQTYQEAVTWCDAYNNYIPCPYEVYCPNQKSLISGIVDTGGESWAPVVNQENEWVQVGTGSVCQLYSEKYGKKPDWGVTGANNEAITRHIMCCRSHAIQHNEVPNDGNQHQQPNQYVIKATNPPLSTPTTSISQHDEESDFSFEMLELSLTQHYNPTWFDRETGWQGQTYQESKDFCNKLNGYIPCPYLVYCPGEGKKVFGGRRGDGESWAAVNDADNEWVQVGAGGECNLYSTTEGEKPGWGLTGKNNEEITRHILCCHQYQAEEGGESAVTPADATNSVVEESDTETAVSIQSRPETGKMTALEISTQELFHPEWFDSSLGWSGGTYNDAKAYCESLPQPNNGHWYLCPHQAYCPNGPRETEPLYLQKDAFEGTQWAPISDKQNGWVMIGKMSGRTCQEYVQINHRDPQWGLDGSSTDMKQHILCCNAPSGIYVSEGNVGSNRKQHM